MNGVDNAIHSWRNRLASVTLPMLSGPEIVEELLSATVNLDRIARLLDRDPPLALDIVLAAGRLPNAPETVQSLQHALNLMGMSRVQNFIRARTARPFDPQSHAHRAFLQAVTVGRFAASLVARWEEKRAPGSSAYLACVALLLGLARWKVPLADPRLAREIEERVWAGERRSMVESELLGCSMGDLNGAVLIDAGFPPDSPLLKSFAPDNATLLEAARCAWTEQLAPEVPAPVGRWLRQTTVPSLLAHLLAWAAQDGWYGHRTLLYLKVVSARENKHLDRVIAEVHRTAVFATKSLGEFASLVLSPAEQLLFPPRGPRSLPEHVEAPAQQKVPMPRPSPQAAPVPADAGAVTARRIVETPPPLPASRPPPMRPTSEGQARSTPPSAAPPAPKLDAPLVQGFVRSCRANNYPDLRQLMQRTGEVLEKGLALRRSMVFLLPANSTQLGCYMRHGFSPEQSSAQLALPTSETNLITRLLEQGGSIHVSGERMEGAQRQLPASLRELACPSGFALTSIRVNGKAVGLIWADTGAATTEIHPSQYEALKIIGANFSTAFSELAKALRK